MLWAHSLGAGGEKRQPARPQEPLKVRQVLAISFCFLGLGSEAARSPAQLFTLPTGLADRAQLEGRYQDQDKDMQPQTSP